MPDGVAHSFDDALDTDNLGPGGDANLNSLEMGGNISQTPGVGNEFKIDVSSLEYLDRTGANPVLTTFAAVSAQAITASQTNYIYINDSNALVVNTSGFPTPEAADFYPLGTVVANGSAITSFNDARPKAGNSHLTRHTSYLFASLPAAPSGFPVVMVTDGLKVGESPSGGTGVLAYWDGAAWFRMSDDTGIAN